MPAVPKPESQQPYLAVSNIEVIYDHVILVLKGVSLSVPEGKIVALLGANGAGKTTTLKAISNLLRAERGEGPSEHDPARRAFDGACAPDRRRDLRDREEPQSEGEGEFSARGAKHQRRAALRRSRLHP